MRRFPTILQFMLIVAAGVEIPAYAATYSFNFNSLSENATASQIATYMTTYLQTNGCTGCTVTVVGAVADTTYDGDGNVVGPSGHPLTLGTSDGATSNSSTTPAGVLGKTNNLISGTVDTFIANTSDSASQISSEIYLDFSLGTGVKISSASFDYEIFPDGSPQQPPDFIFEAGNVIGGTNAAVTSFGTNGTQYGVTPKSSGSDGHSTASPDSSSESSAQYIGTWSGSLNNVSELDFIDWPATIGVDDLSITTTTTVPEPSSVILLFTIMLGIGLMARRRSQKA